MTDKDEEDRFDVLHEEVRQTINKQHQEILETDKKAGKILRINILTFGAVLTAISLLIRFNSSSETPLINSFLSPMSLLFFGCGLITLGASAVIAAITYSASPIQIGVGGRDLQWIFENGMDSEEPIKPDLLAGYSTWIRLNEFPISTNHFRLTLTMLLAAVSIVLMGLGLLYGLIPIPPESPLLSTIKQLAFIFIVISMVAFIYESSEIRSIREFTSEKQTEALTAAEQYGKMLEDGEIEHIFGGTTVRGGTTDDQPSNLRKAIKRGRNLERWLDNNATSIVPDVTNIQKNVIVEQGDFRFEIDATGEVQDGFVIFEVKLEADGNSIKKSHNKLKAAESSFNKDGEMYIVSHDYQPDAIEIVDRHDSLHAVLVDEEIVLEDLSKEA